MVNLISVSGFLGTGKDTLGQILIDQHGFEKVSWAGLLKDVVAVAFSWDRQMLEGSTPESREWRETVDENWAKALDMPHLTPRWVLQYWGTEVVRKGFHDSFWVASAKMKISSMLASGKKVVITDTRFANEFKTIKDLGGITIRIHRGEPKEWEALAIVANSGDNDACKLLQQQGVHPSEYSSVGLPYDFHVANRHSIDDLANSVRRILAEN